MARQYRLMVVWFLLVVLSMPVLASYSIEIEPVKSSIYRNETATFEITIRNFDQTDSRFQVYTIDPAWVVKTVPLRLFVPAQDEDKILLNIRPTTDAEFGAQGVPITFKELDSDQPATQQNIVVNLRNEAIPALQYAATVAMDLSMQYDVDPRDPIQIRLNLRNRNPRDIDNLTAEVTSEHFSSRTEFALSPLSEKTRDMGTVVIDPLTEPGEAEVVAKLYFEGELINQLTKNYRIIEYSQIEQDVQEATLFFKTTKEVTVKNNGNVENVALISVPTSFAKSLFVNSDAPYERTKESGDSSLVWRVPLEPNGSSTVTYVENYRILVLLGLLVLFGLVAYFILRSPVVVIKEAVGISKKGDGVGRIKVRIFLKNRSSRLIRDIQITDRLPSLADVIKAEAPGSITPSKIAVSEKSGTLLKWHLEVLEPYEERVLTYQAKSKLKIIGKMSLPNSKVRFSVSGKERVVYSNNIELIEKFRSK